MEEDIDTILERRTKTVVHEGVRENDAMAAGSSFSKASFKSVNGITGDTTEEVDVDDPDFWTKVVGASKNSESTIDLVTDSRRTKKVTDYRQYMSDNDEDQNDSLYGSDSDETSSSESSAQELAFGHNVASMLKNEFLRSLQSQISYKENREWGGTLIEHWERKDALSVLKYLQRFGYRTDATNRFPTLSKEYGAEEVSSTDDGFFLSFTIFSMLFSVFKARRMMWSLSLLAIAESTDEELRDFVYEWGTSSEKSSVKGKKLIPDKADECVKNDLVDPSPNLKSDTLVDLPCTSDAAGSVLEGEVLFRRFVELSGWATQAYDDAVSFASNHPFHYSRLIGSKAYSKRIETALVESFNGTIWPELQARSWEKVASDGKIQFLHITEEKKMVRLLCTFYHESNSSIINHPISLRLVRQYS